MDSKNSPSPGKYSIFLDSQHSLNNDETSLVSNCSDWQTQLDISLQSLCFLKSVTASLSVSDFQVDNFPVCLSKKDRLEIVLHTDLEILSPNRIINRSKITDLNANSFSVNLDNVIAKDCSTVINYLASKFRNINYYLLYR